MAIFVLSRFSPPKQRLCFKADTEIKVDPLWRLQMHGVFWDEKHSQRAVGVMVSRAIKKVIIIRIYWTIFFTLHGPKSRVLLFSPEKGREELQLKKIKAGQGLSKKQIFMQGKFRLKYDWNKSLSCWVMMQRHANEINSLCKNVAKISR